MIGVLILVAFAPFTLAFPYHQFGLESTRISGGSNATISEIPYIVQVNEDDSDSSDCNASILSRLWVVTAAHCLDGVAASDVSIRAGTDRYMRGGVVIRASNLYVHPNYNNTDQDYDIGLIKLASPLTFGPNIASISLASSKPAVGTSAVVSGWGDLNAITHTTPQQLQKVTLPIVADSQCPDIRTERVLCAGENAGYKSPCYGDSGGPLVVGNTLVGVVSHGNSCRGISVYANVANLRSWILSVASA
ncbi:trypsin alpha-like [Agrilus planipennis]|uniref:Trypsin alpha-like n=1 Tax=Agrilus planipennis TaxID=224129 RepID=A0A1W4XJ67_AGRPL|nr:trypsin alpha-like [Agrilus planipennis]